MNADLSRRSLGESRQSIERSCIARQNPEAPCAPVPCGDRAPSCCLDRQFEVPANRMGSHRTRSEPAFLSATTTYAACACRRAVSWSVIVSDRCSTPSARADGARRRMRSQVSSLTEPKERQRGRKRGDLGPRQQPLRGEWSELLRVEEAVGKRTDAIQHRRPSLNARDGPPTAVGHPLSATKAKRSFQIP